MINDKNIVCESYSDIHYCISSNNIPIHENFKESIFDTNYLKTFNLLDKPLLDSYGVLYLLDKSPSLFCKSNKNE